VAEQLGEARLKLSVDDTALNAGLQRAHKQAQQTGTAIEQAFTKSGKPIQKAANGLEYFIDVNGRARKVTGQFVTVAELQAAGLDKLAGAAGRAGKSINKLAGEGGGGAGGGLLGALGLNPAALGAAAVGAAVVGIGSAAVQTAGQIQKLNAAFTGLTGSAQAAQQLRQDLFTLSKTTPFKNDEILTAAQRFLAVGVNAKNLQGTINRVGAIAAQSGQPLERLALIYAQVYAKGRLQGEENLQFLEAGVDLTDELAKVTGKSGQALRDAMEKGQISIEDVNKALVLATGDMASLQQAGKAVDVAFNNIGDNLGQIFGGFATAIAPALSAAFNVINRILEQAFPSLDKITELFKPLTTEAERFAKALESNPKLIAAIAAVVREWGGLIVGYVVGGLKTVNNILSKLDGNVLVQGLIGAEFFVRKIVLGLGAVRALIVSNAELAGRALTNPAQFAKDIVNAGGIGKFLDKQYEGVRAAREAFVNAKPLKVKVATTGDNKIDGDLSSKPGQTDPLAEQQRRAAAQAELNAITAQGLQQELTYRQQLLALELQSLRTGEGISATTRVQLENQQAILAARRQVAQAQAAVDAELSKPAAERSSAEVDNLLSKVAEANAGVRKAYLDAGISLVQNARTAADALKGAQSSINGVLRGGFDFIGPRAQQDQIARARAAIQPLVDRGDIRTGIDISTPERLFRVAAFAEQLAPAQKQLEQAIQENTAATAANTLKDTSVYLQLPGQSAPIPLPRV